MQIDAQTLNKIAQLSKLALSNAEQLRYQQSLNQMLDVFTALNAVNTESVEPMAHPLSMSQRLRPDQVTESNQQEAFQTVAPQVSDGFYLVPRVIEEPR